MPIRCSMFILLVQGYLTGNSHIISVRGSETDFYGQSEELSLHYETSQAPGLTTAHPPEKNHIIGFYKSGNPPLAVLPAPKPWCWADPARSSLLDTVSQKT
ncbi:hypothetical protein SCFA_820004 [anaerobic digester metagenome]|uniref:Uncharacterized protein n=1 Tax=anaerobic digester metagenome TaxID=1263854 RepID=A0A485M5C9_9ZZZZ